MPQESYFWQKTEKIARSIFSSFGYEEIRTPIIEESKLFSRTLGDLSEVVSKQMFIIKRETDTFALRPEATASIIRAYVEHTLYNFNNVSKFYYMGPMFRAERPQKGRLRQFHHIGCEAIGSYHPFLDAETIFLATGILDALGITGYEVVVNSLGCLNDKKKFSVNLKERLLPRKKDFCQDCRQRMSKNVFRVLDCKNNQCKEIISTLGINNSHFCPECDQHFRSVCKGLDLCGVKYRVDPLLVRGLDYYTRSVFEISHPNLGAQDAIGAGGRYDNLVEELGGPSRGAVGFALGVERLLLAKYKDLSSQTEETTTLDCYVVALGDEALEKSISIVSALRKSGIACDVDFLEGSLKSKLRRADKLAAKYCLIIGENELKKSVCILKNMKAGGQEEVSLSSVSEKLKGALC